MVVGRHLRAVALFSSVAGALWLAPSTAAAQDPPPTDLDGCVSDARCTPVEGIVRRAGDRVPLGAASVFLLPAQPGAETGRQRRALPESYVPPWTHRARTDDSGRFETPPLPPGPVHIVVMAAGAEREEHVWTERDRPVELYIRPLDIDPHRTVVVQREPGMEITERRMEPEEYAAVPGGGGDPIRALQNLPGVARGPIGMGVIAFRGANPVQSAVYVGEHRVPRIFHAGSLDATMHPNTIAGVTFAPGNFDARWGRSSAGLVVATPRKGRRDGIHGFADLDVTAAATGLEGPVGKKGSFLLGAQRSYADVVVLGVARALDQEVEQINLPNYYDYQAFVDHPIGDWSFTVRLFGAGDRVRNAGSQPLDLTEEAEFDFRTNFHRLDLVFRRAEGPWDFLWSPSVRIDNGRVDFRGPSSQRRRDLVVSQRAQLGRQQTKRLRWDLGTEVVVQPFWTTEQTGAPGDSMGAMTQRAQDVETDLGLYGSAQIGLGPRVDLLPGTRVSTFTVGRHAVFASDPRLNLRVRAAPRTTFTTGVGMYSTARFARVEQTTGVVPGDLFTHFQAAPIKLPSAFQHLDLGLSGVSLDEPPEVDQSIQTSVGVAQGFGDGWDAEVTGFYRDHDNDTIFAGARSFGGGIYRNERTHSFGGEFIVRKQLTARVFGWVAYTLMRTESYTRGAPERRVRGDWDQRHALVVVGSVKLPRSWMLGGRFRLVSGLPYTPVLGSITQTTPAGDPGGPVPISGLYNSAQLPAFHQLDVRVDKTWTFRKSVLAVYLDLQNVYNRQNPEGVFYSSDFRRELRFIGLPILPTLGVKFTW